MSVIDRLESATMMVDIMGGYVIPFGKHKGETLAHVRVSDARYMSWLYKQPWVRTRYPEMSAFLIAACVQDVRAVPDNATSGNA